MIDNVFIVNPDGLVEYDPALRMIEVFKKLIVNSRKAGKGKMFETGKAARIANEKISYAYLMVSPTSTYFYSYKEDETRSVKILQALGIKDWEVDEDVTNAMTYFKEELNAVLSFSMMNNGLKAAFETNQYFADVDYNQRDAKGQLVYEPKDVIGSLKSIGEIIDGLEALIKRYSRDGVARKQKLRGKKNQNPLELPPNQRR